VEVAVTARATWKGTVLAESDATVIVEGNHYFPPEALRREFVVESDTGSHCAWKGDAKYLTVVVDGESNPDAVWYYPAPYDAAEEIRDYVAFWHGVEVTAEPGDGREGPVSPRGPRTTATPTS
jgi:uncharacterized protein (DUF427 family)